MVDKSVSSIDHNNCTGCKMFGDICPKQAISFSYDKGFWYPDVNADNCINCGLCSKKCPGLNPANKTGDSPVACIGAKTKDETIREHSTSGGFFTEVAAEWIKNGGYCIAAVYDEECRIIHTCSNELSSIERFRQSKYAQSDIEGMYKLAKQLLYQGEKVLFCGSPCQIEALKSFLGKGYDNLLTIDFVCLGICSPYAFKKYLDMLERKYHAQAIKVWFKNKTYGWRSISTRVDFKNGKKYLEPGSGDLFMRSFVTDALIMRPSCEFCRFRKIPHVSDFTLADFWGVENVNPEIDDNKGLSAVFINTDNGKILFDKMSSRMEYFYTTAEDICRGNFSILKPLKPHPLREEFFDYLESHTFKAAMYKYSSYNMKVRLHMAFRRLKSKMNKFARRLIK